MSKGSCTYIPSKGVDVFRQLKKAFGYNIAREVFMRAAVNSKFKDDFKDTLSLTTEGVVTFDSLMANKTIQDYIGDKKMIEGLSKSYAPLEDTRENFKMLLESAYTFNTSNSARDKYVATIEYTPDNKLEVRIQRKSKEAIDRFNNQYSTTKLNEKLAEMFAPLGITIGDLTSAELSAGRVGVIDFSNAKDVANGFATLIRAANNMEGEVSLSEEFSHMIIGVFRDSPLVSRCINILAEDEGALRNILGNDYEDVTAFYTDNEGYVDMQEVAEEALGHVLQKNLLKNNTPTPRPSLFRRMIDWIKNLFKNFSVEDIHNAVIDVDSSMDQLSKDILRGTKVITQEDIAKSQRDIQLNNLSDRVDRNLEILRKARDTELKRDKITNGEIAGINITIGNLESHMAESADTVEGLLTYAHEALTKMKGLSQSLRRIQDNPAVPQDEIFRTLRLARTYIKSYGVFISDMEAASHKESYESDDMFDRPFVVGGETINLRDIVRQLNSLSTALGKEFVEIAIPAFTKFLQPMYGDRFVIPSGKRAGEIVTVEDLIKEAKNGDISLLDRWLDSAANSSDTLIQLINKRIMTSKDSARLATMDFFREIWALRQKAESMGITNFRWMFEVDAEGNKSGNYVSDVNYAEFERQRKLMEEELTAEFGINPSGPTAIAKIEKRKAWRRENCTTTEGPMIPLKSKFPGAVLTDNQQEILNEFLALKARMDGKYPDNRVDLNKAIQMRRTGGQRWLDSVNSPSQIFENIRESVRNAIFEREDDDALFGDRTVNRGLKDFDGREHLTLPVLYTTRLKNPNDLTEDVFGSLMAYAWAANHYNEMSKIVDPLEVGRVLIEEERKIPKTRGGRKLVERFKSHGEEVTSDITETNRSTNIVQRIDDLLESQVYGKYLKDGGVLDILGKKVSVNKVTSTILKYSSLTHLGFNFLANLANIATGVAMTNIEAVAGQFFNPKELAKADGIYTKELTEFIPELGARVKSSPLALFCELLDVKQEFGKNAKNATQRKNLLLRLFGETTAFLGQECGDHWLYTRVALAMSLREKVLCDGQETTLWDAIKKSVVDNNGLKSIDRSKIKNLDGSQFDFGEMSRRIHEVNKVCFGVYNDDDANAASRVALGRLCQQYRKWMKIQYSRRFQKGQENVILGTWEEGYYRTLGRLVNELRRGERQFSDKLTTDEKQNVKRALFEILQTFAVFALVNLISWPDDKDRPWLLKLAEYSSRRLLHELGGLTPSTIMPQEILKTIKSPIPAASWALDIFNVVNSALTPSDWVEELQSGPYKGMTRFERNLYKSPLPFVPWYNQIKKFTGKLDTSIQYYVRPTTY